MESWDNQAEGEKRFHQRDFHVIFGKNSFLFIFSTFRIRSPRWHLHMRICQRISLVDPSDCYSPEANRCAAKILGRNDWQSNVLERNEKLFARRSFQQWSRTRNKGEMKERRDRHEGNDNTFLTNDFLFINEGITTRARAQIWKYHHLSRAEGTGGNIEDLLFPHSPDGEIQLHAGRSRLIMNMILFLIKLDVSEARARAKWAAWGSRTKIQ